MRNIENLEIIKKFRNKKLHPTGTGKMVLPGLWRNNMCAQRIISKLQKKSTMLKCFMFLLTNELNKK